MNRISGRIGEKNGIFFVKNLSVLFQSWVCMFDHSIDGTGFLFYFGSANGEREGEWEGVKKIYIIII